MSEIIVGADIVPTPSNQAIFESGNMDIVVDEKIQNILSNVDYRIFNLEVPLTDSETPIKKCGPNLRASTKAVRGLNCLKVDFVTLANNHIMDQDVQGLDSTIKVLNSANIAYAGAGDRLATAEVPHVFEIDGVCVGVYCCAEHEFSIAQNKHAGANPFDPLESLDHIAQLKSKCDYVICLYHGGKEHYRYPSPELQKKCRKIVEKGADLVVCQHSHCIGCMEEYDKGTIIYGQGNFLFDDSESIFWRTSLLLKIDLKNRNLEYIPVCKNENAVRMADLSEKKNILNEFLFRSQEILKNGELEKRYEEFAASMLSDYILKGDTVASSIIFRIINKISKNRLREYMTKKRVQKYKYALINQYDCEAHRELILKGLEISENE